MGSDQHRVQSPTFPPVLQTVKTTESPCENQREMGKHNQGHRGVSLEKHTQKNSISKQYFSGFPERRWKTVNSPCWRKRKSQTCRRWVTLCQSGYCEIPASNVRASAEVTDRIPQPRKANAIPAKGEEQNWIKLRGPTAPIYSKLPRNRRTWLPPVHTARPASAWPWALSPPLANRNLSK